MPARAIHCSLFPPNVTDLPLAEVFHGRLAAECPTAMAFRAGLFLGSSADEAC